MSPRVKFMPLSLALLATLGSAFGVGARASASSMPQATIWNVYDGAMLCVDATVGDKISRAKLNQLGWEKSDAFSIHPSFEAFTNSRSKAVISISVDGLTNEDGTPFVRCVVSANLPSTQPRSEFAEKMTATGWNPPETNDVISVWRLKNARVLLATESAKLGTGGVESGANLFVVARN